MRTSDRLRSAAYDMHCKDIDLEKFSEGRHKTSISRGAEAKLGIHFCS